MTTGAVMVEISIQTQAKRNW